MVVGIEQVFLVGIDDLVMIGIVAGINDPGRTTGDGLAVVVDPDGICGVAIRSRGADIDLVVIKITSATADIGKFRLVGILIRVASKLSGV